MIFEKSVRIIFNCARYLCYLNLWRQLSVLCLKWLDHIYFMFSHSLLHPTVMIVIIWHSCSKLSKDWTNQTSFKNEEVDTYNRIQVRLLSSHDHITPPVKVGLVGSTWDSVLSGSKLNKREVANDNTCNMTWI